MAFYVGNARVTYDVFFKELRNELNQLYGYDAYLECNTVTDLYIFRILDKNNDPVCTLTYYDVVDNVFRATDVINWIGKYANKPTTNFDKVTKDMDTLAQFITNITDACYDPVSECDKCPLRECGCTYKDLMAWFKEEAPKDDKS